MTTGIKTGKVNLKASNLCFNGRNVPLIAENPIHMRIKISVISTIWKFS